MHTAKLKRLLWFAAVFLAGWRLWLWAVGNETLVEVVSLIWFYAAALAAALVLLLAVRPKIQFTKQTGESGLSVTIMFSAGWRITLLMAVGFGISQALAWWIFYSGRWYYPQADDVLALVAFGCSISALVGATHLIARQTKAPKLKLQNRSWAASSVCFHGALFLCGGFTATMSTFAMERLMPEFVAAATGVIATAGICVLALVVQLRPIDCIVVEC